MSTLMMDNPVDQGDKVNSQMDPDPDLLNSQSSMQGLSSLSGKQAEHMTLGLTMWQTPLDTLPRFDIVKPQGYQPENLNENTKSYSAAVSGSYETSVRVIEATRTDSKPTIPSAFSPSGSPVLPPSKHSHLKMPKQQVSEPAHKRKRRNKKGVAGDEDEEDDSMRKKHLETQNTELERKHSNFQQEYTGLINELTQLKNELMVHGACNDPNIDAWIEIEAKRLVEKINDSSCRVYGR